MAELTSNNFKFYADELLKIAAPIILGNLGFILIGVGDVLIAGRHSTDTLAAISIAAAITSCIQTFGIGIIASVSPVLSNFRGAKQTAKKYFFPTIRFALVIAFLIMLSILFVIPLIDMLKFSGKLTPMIKQYMFVTAFATFGGYLHMAVKEFLQAFEIVVFPNLLTVFSVFLNIILNIVLVFGFGPIPSMGVLGLAVASLIVRYFMGIVLLIYSCKIMRFSDYKDLEYYKGLLKVGLPVSLAILIEFVAFNSIALFLGRISGIYAAAQNIICTMTNVSFMIPLALSNAISVKVGYANGSKNLIELKKYSFVGVVMSVGFMAVSGLVFATFPRQLVSLFSTDVNLIKIAAPIILILAVYQVFDGLQVSLSGIFKGLKKTKIVMLSNFVAYWLISIPLGYTLAFKYQMNIRGFWCGLLISSIILCIMLVCILYKNIRKLEHRK